MKTKETAAKILKDLSLGDMAVLLIRLTEDRREQGEADHYTAITYHAEGLTVELWACPKFVHMHDGETHYVKELHEAIRNTSLPALQWIHENYGVPGAS